MKLALFLAILFVVLCSFLSNGVEREEKTNAKDIWIVPKADYDVNNRRKKYGTSSVVEDKLTKADCETTFGIRGFMQPTKTELKILFPPGVSNDEANASPPILVISGGKYETLAKHLAEGTTMGSTAENHWVLWYSPVRPERASRKIYIITHHLEAAKYKTHFETHIGTKVGAHFDLLRNSIRLVSCQINSASGKDPKSYYGFGLNRYCGMALMAKKAVANFWMADDNLLVVSKIEDKLSLVETAANDGGAAVVGFKSGADGIVNEATRNPKLSTMNAVFTDGTTKPDTTVVALENRGDNDFLEQLYYFRGAEFNKNLGGKFRSFSPMFLSSKEDMTLSYDLFLNDIPVKFVRSAEIFKVNMQFTPYDSNAENKFVPDKDLLITDIKAQETAIQYVKPSSWKFFGKDVDFIGTVSIKTDEKLGEVARPTTQTENWVDTVSKTQEVVLYKCAVVAFNKKKAAADVATYYNPDAKFKFDNNAEWKA